MPEFWYRRIEDWCEMRDSEDNYYNWSYDASTGSGYCVNPSIYYSNGYAPTDWSPSTGGEYPNLDVVFESNATNPDLPRNYTGPTFWKVPQFFYPNESSLEGYALDVRTFDSTTYNNWVDIWDTNVTVTESEFANFDTRMNGSYHLKTDGPGSDFSLKSADGDTYFGDVDLPLDGSYEYFQNESSGDSLDRMETNFLIDWGNTKDRVWSRYYKTVLRDGEYTATYINESEAPPALQEAEYTINLLGSAHYASHEKEANVDDDNFNATEQWCWTCANASQCTLEVYNVTLESTAIVKYRWYKWRYQVLVFFLILSLNI